MTGLKDKDGGVKEEYNVAKISIFVIAIFIGIVFVVVIIQR